LIERETVGVFTVFLGVTKRNVEFDRGHVCTVKQQLKNINECFLLAQ